jgi:hypothetical protein
MWAENRAVIISSLRFISQLSCGWACELVGSSGGRQNETRISRRPSKRDADLAEAVETRRGSRGGRRNETQISRISRMRGHTKWRWSAVRRGRRVKTRRGSRGFRGWAAGSLAEPGGCEADASRIRPLGSYTRERSDPSRVCLPPAPPARAAALLSRPCHERDPLIRAIRVSSGEIRVIRVSSRKIHAIRVSFGEIRVIRVS